MSAVVLRWGAWSARVERRQLGALAALAVAALALALAGLCRGDGWTPPGEVIAALTGADPSVVITEWRLPRVTAALLFGAALGVAGAIFQNLTRNELGSPDVIGLDSGAYTGVLVALTIAHGAGIGLTGAALAGGLSAALIVYVLSARRGVVGLQLVVIGVAVNAMLIAINNWLVLRAELEVALASTGWSTGSLNGIDWSSLAVPALVVGAAAPLLARLARSIEQAALGGDVAAASGLSLTALRLGMTVVGVAVTAVVTAVAGPIAFVALAAPQIGRRLVGSWATPLLPAALTGAVLMLGADIVAQSLPGSSALPVGVVTTAIGGSYLIWLLARELRS